MSRPSNRHRRWGSLVAAAGALVALASPMSASAIVPTDVPDIGADTGRFTLPITCTIQVPWLANLTVLNLQGSVDIQGIAPVQLAPGQPFYLSQGRGALTLPSWLSSLGGIVAVNRADAKVTALNIQATGSTPSIINVANLQPLIEGLADARPSVTFLASVPRGRLPPFTPVLSRRIRRGAPGGTGPDGSSPRRSAAAGRRRRRGRR